MAVLLVVGTLLLGGVALEPSTPTVAQSGGPDLALWCAVEQGISFGGSYHLTSLSWQVSGTASGGGYRLLAPVAPALRGSGCCCTYLPLVMRQYP